MDQPEIENRLRKLANMAASRFPVLSLYLDARANERGRDYFQAWLRKEFSDRLRAFSNGSEEAGSFNLDTERINSWLADNLSPSTNGAAIFACSGENLFETLQFEAYIEHNALYVQDQPQLYPLCR